MSSVRAVVADSGTGETVRETCAHLLRRGLDPSTWLHVDCADAPSFGVRIGEGGLGCALDETPLLLQENNMRSARDQTDPNSGIPRLKVAAAPVPRGSTPPHVTTGQGDDDLDLDKLVTRLLDECAERDISPSALSLEEAAEQLLAHGDAGVPTGRVGAVDAEGLDDEVIEQVLKHLDGRMSPSALDGLRDMLSGGADGADPVPPWLKGREAELERIAEPLDRHSASDMHGFNNAMDQMEEEARKLMHSRGQFEAPVRTRPAGSGERWHPGRNEPPGTGLPHPGGAVREPGSLVPRTSRPKPFTASDAALARVKPRPFHKVIGVKKRHLPKVAW
jgi:hypothetical protein